MYRVYSCRHLIRGSASQLPSTVWVLTLSFRRHPGSLFEVLTQQDSNLHNSTRIRSDKSHDRSVGKLYTRVASEDHLLKPSNSKATVPEIPVLSLLPCRYDL